MTLELQHRKPWIAKKAPPTATFDCKEGSTDHRKNLRPQHSFEEMFRQWTGTGAVAQPPPPPSSGLPTTTPTTPAHPPRPPLSALPQPVESTPASATSKHPLPQLAPEGPQAKQTTTSPTTTTTTTSSTTAASPSNTSTVAAPQPPSSCAAAVQRQQSGQPDQVATFEEARRAAIEHGFFSNRQGPEQAEDPICEITQGHRLEIPSP